MVTLDRRIEAILHLLDDEWDLFMGIVTETDRLHHFLWSASHEDNPRHGDFLDFYRKVDGFIGTAWAKTAERCGDDVGLLIVSDHGFTDIKQEVYVNTFLREKGYLDFGSFPPKSLEEIAAGSRAFALDPSRIYINRKDKFPLGSVEEGDYEELRSELKEKFLKLTFNGEKVIRKVFLKEDLYSGHCLNNAPDLVLLSHRGYDLKGALAPVGVFGRRSFTGAHTRDDAVFFLKGPVPVAPTSGTAEIVDVTPTILDLAGIQAGTPLDGVSRAR
jgi:predicted AlkP superfamily phosphohydrolase/phosphomutase